MRFVLTLIVGLFFALTASAQTTQRALRPTFSQGAMTLELGGVPMGMVRSIAGGAIYGEVIADKPAANNQIGKRVGQVRYAPITIEVGAEMTPAFWDIIRRWPALPASGRLNGAIVFGDLNLKQTKRMEFMNAVITEIELPALSAKDSKKPFTLLVTIQPDKIENRPGKGTLASTAGIKSKQLFSNNFRVVMDGVDLSRLISVDGILLKQNLASSRIGDLRRLEAQQASLEYSDLVLTVSEAYSTSLETWFQDAVIKGAGTEREARIELLGVDLKSVVGTITLRGVGIWKLGMSEQQAGTEALRTVEARLYIEGITIDIK